jgi:synaptojanin
MVDISSEDDSKDMMSDIFAIGFEEIVDLNASNIMAARYFQ